MFQVISRVESRVYGRCDVNAVATQCLRHGWMDVLVEVKPNPGAHVNVGFFRGAELADPDGLLEGSGRFMRHVKLRPGLNIDHDALEGADRNGLSRYEEPPERKRLKDDPASSPRRPARAARAERLIMLPVRSSPHKLASSAALIRPNGLH